MARKREIEPYCQGELDGLCGVYAIINAIAVLCPEFDEDGAAILFKRLVSQLTDTVRPPTRAVSHGMTHEQVEHLLRVAEHEMARLLEVRLRSAALQLSARPKLGELWSTLRVEVRRKQVAILGLTGASDHWTVAFAVSEKVIRLADSQGRNVLMRSRCTTHRARTRFCIDPSAVILVRRLKSGSGRGR